MSVLRNSKKRNLFFLMGFMAIVTFIISCVNETPTDYEIFAPKSEIVAPLDNAVFDRDNNIIVKTNISDKDGEILNVSLYIDENLYATDTTIPYEISINPADLSKGNHDISIITIDNDSLTSNDYISISINNDAPECVIISPDNNSEYSQSMIPITVNTDDDSQISKVDYYIDEQFKKSVTNSPFSYTWDAQNASTTITHTIKAIAFDNDNEESNPSLININILPNQTPTCEITTPNNGDEFSIGEIVNIEVDADDNDGSIEEVKFYMNNSLLTSVSNEPYSYDWDTAGNEIADYVLKIRAIDNQGAETLDSITVSLNNQAPICEITAPSEGDDFTIGDDITITATATDDLSVTEVEFFVDGNPKHTDTTSPYSYTWNSGSASVGNHILKAVAKDNIGTTGEDIVAVSLTENPIPTDGLVAWYPFNNITGSVVPDASDNEHNGVNHGASSTTDRHGNQNSAMDFDGVNDYVDCNAQLLNNSLISFSISVWLNIEDYIHTYPMIVGQARIHLGIDQSIAKFRAYTGASWSGPEGGNLVNGTWYHLVGIWNTQNSKQKLYINNALIATSNISGNINYLSEDTGLGARTNAGESALKGKLDDIRIYNRALDEDEIDALYHEGGYKEK